jgi:hypothetical protein
MFLRTVTRDKPAARGAEQRARGKETTDRLCKRSPDDTGAVGGGQMYHHSSPKYRRNLAVAEVVGGLCREHPRFPRVTVERLVTRLTAEFHDLPLEELIVVVGREARDRLDYADGETRAATG